mmetsp:Transcript_30161/g.96275  ORF Transcript_30161/g.96275 Transcript_30161/m.96275 type:complete len:237 (-) Transcript_30161:723-1433(-)
MANNVSACVGPQSMPTHGEAPSAQLSSSGKGATVLVQLPLDVGEGGLLALAAFVRATLASRQPLLASISSASSNAGLLLSHCKASQSSADLRERPLGPMGSLGAAFSKDHTKIATSCMVKPATCIGLSSSPRRKALTTTITTSFMMTPVRMKVVAELILMNRAWETFMANERHPLARSSCQYSARAGQGGSVRASGREGQSSQRARCRPASTRITRGATSITKVSASSRFPSADSE